MNLVDTLRGFARRWYIVVPGVVVAAALAFGAWHVVKPQYVRTATQVLLPGTGSLPATSPNPYLFISGLTDAADVVVRAVGSSNGIDDITARYPGVTVQVTRDPTTSGPVILTTVTAGDDKDAAEVLELLVQRTSTTLEQLQTEEKIAPRYHITVIRLSVDDKSELKQRKRLLATGGSAGGVLFLTLLLASVIDGLRRRRELPDGRLDGAAGAGARTLSDSGNDDISESGVPVTESRPTVRGDDPDVFEPAGSAAFGASTSYRPHHESMRGNSSRGSSG